MNELQTKITLIKIMPINVTLGVNICKMVRKISF